MTSALLAHRREKVIEPTIDRKPDRVTYKSRLPLHNLRRQDRLRKLDEAIEEAARAVRTLRELWR